MATGQMLINWFVSAFSEGHYLRHVVTPQDLKILATQFCTHLLAAGVIRQIEDVNAPLELLFRVRILCISYLLVIVLHLFERHVMEAGCDESAFRDR